MRKLVVLALLAIIGVAVTFVIGLRTKNPAVLGAIRRMNKAYMNPRQMRTAGTPGAYASIIRHVGRSSGRTYETPVGAVPTEDGFVIALPYGSQSDWVKNVLVAGTATIVDEGETFAVRDPELVAMREVDGLFPDSDRQAHKAFAVDQALRWGDKERIETAAPLGPATAG